MVFQVLNKLKWKDSLSEAEIVFVHRGVPKDEKEIRGNEISGLDKAYFYVGKNKTKIPLHRIKEIRLEGKILWKRN